jgi:hypothetical protein
MNGGQDVRTGLSKKAGLLALLVVASVVLLLIVRAHGDDGGDASAVAAITDMEHPAHRLADVPGAAFVSVFVYDANGGVSSFMVGGGTGEFLQMAAAVGRAQTVDGSEDASFGDLLVFSFGGNDTLEVPYSVSRNLLDFNGAVYRPAADLAPLITKVENRLT